MQPRSTMECSATCSVSVKPYNSVNLEEYNRRIENAHTVTGVPSFWEELQAMTEDRDRWRRGVIHLVEIMDCYAERCDQCEEVFAAYDEHIKTQHSEEDPTQHGRGTTDSD